MSSTLCDFKANQLEDLSQLSVYLVQLAQECGLVYLGTFAIDAAKVKVKASRHKAMSYKRVFENETKLRAQIGELMECATSTDAA